MALTGSTVRLCQAYIGRATVTSSGARSWHDGLATSPIASAAGLQLGKTKNISLQAAQAGSAAVLQVGGGTILPIDLSAAGFSGCELWTDGRLSLQGGALSSRLQLTAGLILMPGG